MNGPTTYIVVGSGSIGRRHIANLKALYPDATIGCVSASGRRISTDECGAGRIFSTIESALSANPRSAIIASPAPFHLGHALPFLQAGIPTLIEKPLCSSLAELYECITPLIRYSDLVEIGYNLRYLPCAKQLKKLLEQQYLGSLHHVRIEVGQYLPDWRSGNDYRSQVSAQKRLGGGALLELSHELDYLLWLFGTFSEVSALKVNSGTLGIDVEDSVDAIFNRNGGPTVSLHLDFLQRPPARYCTVSGAKGKLHWDLLTNRLTFSDVKGNRSIIYDDDSYQFDMMYLDELKRFDEFANKQLTPMVNLEHAINVMRLIEAIETSSEKRQVVAIRDIRC